MKVQPWSHTRLDNFKNCPKQFYEVSVAKRVQDVKSEQVLWGQQVHTHFEKRIKDKTPLPPDLQGHEEFMAWIDSLPGEKSVELKAALNTQLQPTTYFAHDVWYRGVVDVKIVAGETARIIDHKTGKHHTKYGQLKLFALTEFHTNPVVNTVRAEYYWTQTRTLGGQTYTRDMIPSLWAEFVPDLKQYAEAFRNDVWQPRPSGLCNGWCPVTNCEFWKPKRQRG